MYAIILTEPDVAYCETYVFERKDIWYWLNQQVEFPEGTFDVNIAKPTGYLKGDIWLANVTIGSPKNDLALALVSDDCKDAGVKPLRISTDYPEAEDDGEAVDLYVAASKKALSEMNVHPDNIYQGLLY